MSKRFGRNQKRKLTNELKTLRNQRDHYRNKAAYVEATLRDIMEALPHNFAALQPELHIVKDERGVRYYEWAERKGCTPRAIYDPLEAVKIVSHRIAIDPFFAQRLRDATMDQVHFRMCGSGGGYSYAISDAALRGLDEEFMIPRIAREFANLLFKTLKEGKA